MRKIYWKSHCYWGGSGNSVEVCWVDAVIKKKQEEASWGRDDFLVLDLNAGHLWKEVHGVKLCIHPFMSFLFNDKTEKPIWVCLFCKLLFSVILEAFHRESLALAASTHDSLSLWRHSVWKRSVWARHQVFFIFLLSSILHQPSLGRSQQMSECDFSWDYWIIGQVCLRPHFMQDWGAFVITDIYISVFFLSFFLFSFKENSTLSMYNWHTQSV